MPIQPNLTDGPGATQIRAVRVTTEYGRLRSVVMRYAGDAAPTLDGPGIDPILGRQKTTSRWAGYSPARVRAQQQTLIDLLRERGTEVVLLPTIPGCYAQHYPRDIGFAIDTVLYTARLNSQHRYPETAAIAALSVPDAARSVVAAGTVEGGDVMLHDRLVLVGLSEETSSEGVESLQDALGQQGIDREVVPVGFAGPGIVHLDDHFNIVAPGIALIHREVFTADQIRWFTNHFDELVDVSDEEALAVQANVLTIAPGTVVMAQGSDRLAGQLVARGVEVLTINYSEVTRIPGSLRCTTLPLLRD